MCGALDSEELQKESSFRSSINRERHRGLVIGSAHKLKDPYGINSMGINTMIIPKIPEDSDSYVSCASSFRSSINRERHRGLVIGRGYRRRVRTLGEIIC